MKPLVSVICLCYNHEHFVKEALDSVVTQSYRPLQMIIVEDASQDKSAQVIQAWLEQYQKDSSETLVSVTFIKHITNQGICQSFNEALQKAKGKYIIDFATDDLLLPTRIAQQVAVFEALPVTYGVLFSNARYINEQGHALHTHYKINDQQQAIETVPQGEVYTAVLTRYFICTPTMMMRKQVLEKLQGYDETLHYEDFDFWVRSARHYQYYYLDEITTLRRLVKHSLSTQFYQKKRNQLLEDTLKVCKKAYQLNQQPAEDYALAKNLQYHLRQSFYMQCFPLVQAYYTVLQRERLKNYITRTTRLIQFLGKLSIPTYRMY
ncbi:MAG: glycosyltransferase, partial [Bacteroidota bacterium]